MTDKQRIENLKHQVETLVKENEALKHAMSLERSAALSDLFETYESLINELKDKKEEYDELISTIKIQWATMRENIE